MNTVVIIDMFTKGTCKILLDSISKQVTVLNDLRELSTEHNNSVVIFFEPSVPSIVYPEVVKNIQDELSIDFRFVYFNDEFENVFDSSVKKYKIDFSTIDLVLCYAVVENDKSILDSYKESTVEIDSYKSFRDKLPAELISPFKSYHSSYLAMRNEYSKIISENLRLNNLLSIMESTNKKTKSVVDKLKSIAYEVIDKLHYYETMMSEADDKVSNGFYPERPKILYIKQISHLSGIDALLTSLFVAISKQKLSSVKILKLVDSSSALQIRYVPNTYTFISDVYSTAELSNPQIITCSSAQLMLDNLLLNRNKLEYLIIHDMRSCVNPSIDYNLIDLYLNEMSSDYAILGEYNNILSDDSTSAEYKWTYKEIMKSTGTSSIQLLNHPTIVKILGDLL